MCKYYEYDKNLVYMAAKFLHNDNSGEKQQLGELALSLVDDATAVAMSCRRQHAVVLSLHHSSPQRCVGAQRRSRSAVAPWRYSGPKGRPPNEPVGSQGGSGTCYLLTF